MKPISIQSALTLTIALSIGTSCLAGGLVDVSRDVSMQTVTFNSNSQDPESAARNYLTSKAASLNLPADLSNLQFESITESPIGNHVRFIQVKNGVEVDGASIVLTMNQNNQVLTYINNTVPTSNNRFETISLYTLTPKQAAQVAYDVLKLTASPTSEDIVKKVVIQNGVSRAVYQINLSAPVNKVWSWEILIDASSGQVVRSQSRSFDVRPTAVSAQVFEPNPTLHSGKAYGTVPGYDDSNHGDTPFFDSMLAGVKLDNLSFKDSKYSLSGPNVQITELESPKNPDCTTKDPSMSYKRDNPCFIDVSAYYFIDKTLRYLKGPLGFKLHPLKYKGGIKVDPHGVDGDDNSHYDQHTDILAFGEGGVPDAQDHDVVIHELGHAIHNWITKGHLSQIEGLSEGIGDYWASSYDRQYTKKGDVAYNWTFSYDGHNNFWPGRTNNVSVAYPAAVQGQFEEIHNAGQMWASVCMDVYDAIGKLKTDKIHWTAIAMLDSTSGQLDAAKAFIVATRQLYPKETDTINTVVEKFQKRGFAVK